MLVSDIDQDNRLWVSGAFEPYKLRMLYTEDILYYRVVFLTDPPRKHHEIQTVHEAGIFV